MRGSLGHDLLLLSLFELDRITFLCHRLGSEGGATKRRLVFARLLQVDLDKVLPFKGLPIVGDDPL